MEKPEVTLQCYQQRQCSCHMGAVCPQPSAPAQVLCHDSLTKNSTYTLRTQVSFKYLDQLKSEMLSTKILTPTNSDGKWLIDFSRPAWIVTRTVPLMMPATNTVDPQQLANREGCSTSNGATWPWAIIQRVVGQATTAVVTASTRWQGPTPHPALFTVWALGRYGRTFYGIQMRQRGR